MQLNSAPNFIHLSVGIPVSEEENGIEIVYILAQILGV
jgi:hypothetical protein